jgi:hypothetical protein
VIRQQGVDLVPEFADGPQRREDAGLLNRDVDLQQNPQLTEPGPRPAHVVVVDRSSYLSGKVRELFVLGRQLLK